MDFLPRDAVEPHEEEEKPVKRQRRYRYVEPHSPQLAAGDSSSDWTVVMGDFQISFGEWAGTHPLLYALVIMMVWQLFGSLGSS